MENARKVKYICFSHTVNVQKVLSHKKEILNIFKNNKNDHHFSFQFLLLHDILTEIFLLTLDLNEKACLNINISLV
jgi:hypothetical protein